jgi:hypothetical protein
MFKDLKFILIRGMLFLWRDVNLIWEDPHPHELMVAHTQVRRAIDTDEDAKVSASTSTRRPWSPPPRCTSEYQIGSSLCTLGSSHVLPNTSTGVWCVGLSWLDTHMANSGPIVREDSPVGLLASALRAREMSNKHKVNYYPLRNWYLHFNYIWDCHCFSCLDCPSSIGLWRQPWFTKNWGIWWAHFKPYLKMQICWFLWQRPYNAWSEQWICGANRSQYPTSLKRNIYNCCSQK